MLCPLCQTEYPAGAAECDGCGVALVATSEAAAAARVELWSGEDRRRIEKLLAALEAAEIPSYCAESAAGAMATGFRIVPEAPRLGCAVWVLRKDAQRAEEIIQRIEQAEEAESPDVEEGGGK